MTNTPNFFVVPAALADNPFVCRSGNTYTPVNSLLTNVATGDILDTINLGARQIGGPDSGAQLPWVASRFYLPVKGATPVAVLSVSSTIYAIPFRTSGNVPIQSLAASITTGQTGGAFHMGLYTDLNGVPTSLVAGSDSGAQIATSGAGVITFTPAAPLALNDGWYWMALTATASSTMPSFIGFTANAAAQLSSDLGFDTAAHALATSGEFLGGVSATFTYGALPATFPTAGYALSLNAAVPGLVLGT